MALNGIIFDLDGVLCRTDEYHYQAWKKIADDLGIYFDREINDRLRGISREESLEIILERYEGPALSGERKKELKDRKNIIYRESLKHMSPEDLSGEVRDTLSELRSGRMRLAVGSSSKNTAFILERIGLSDFFDAVVDGNMISHSKPDPEVFLKSAEMIGTAPEECLVVEDAVSGVKAGHAGGFRVACVGDAARAGAGDYNMESLCELLEICNTEKNAAQLCAGVGASAKVSDTHENI